MHSIAKFRKNTLEDTYTLNTEAFALVRPVSCIKASWNYAHVVALWNPQLYFFKQNVMDYTEDECFTNTKCNFNFLNIRLCSFSRLFGKIYLI